MNDTRDNRGPEQADGSGAAPGRQPGADPAAAEDAEQLEGTAVEIDAEATDAEATEAEVAPAEAANGGDESEDELAAARRERDEFLELAQRARAELENYRKRVSAEADKAERRGRAAVARGLLPALDNLERALQAAGVDPDGARPEGEPLSEEVSAQTALAEGVALVYRELRDGLGRAGVEAFDPTGEAFDPLTCEAVATGQSDGAAKGSVIEVLERGYRINGEVLRPARVVVSG